MVASRVCDVTSRQFPECRAHARGSASAGWLNGSKERGRVAVNKIVTYDTYSPIYMERCARARDILMARIK